MMFNLHRTPQAQLGMVHNALVFLANQHHIFKFCIPYDIIITYTVVLNMEYGLH